MALEWQKLTDLTGNKEFLVSQVKFKDTGVTINGEFELPPLVRFTYEDQVFIAMFVRSHGSIKDMESTFGVSYPTIKARLNRISEQLGFVKIEKVVQGEDVLSKLERGEISAKQALEKLKA